MGKKCKNCGHWINQNTSYLRMIRNKQKVGCCFVLWKHVSTSRNDASFALKEERVMDTKEGVLKNKMVTNATHKMETMPFYTEENFYCKYYTKK